MLVIHSHRQDAACREKVGGQWGVGYPAPGPCLDSGCGSDGGGDTQPAAEAQPRFTPALGWRTGKSLGHTHCVTLLELLPSLGSGSSCWKDRETRV